MRTQPERPPAAAHGGLTQAGSRCQRTTAPMRCSLGSLFQSEAYGPLDAVIADLPWRSRPHLVAQASNPLGDKTIAPHSHRETCGAQFGGHRGVALPAGRTPRLLQPLPQSYLLLWTDQEFSLLRT